MLNIDDYIKSPNDRWSKKNRLEESIPKEARTMETAADFLSNLKTRPQTEFVLPSYFTSQKSIISISKLARLKYLRALYDCQQTFQPAFLIVRYLASSSSV